MRSALLEYDASRWVKDYEDLYARYMRNITLAEFTFGTNITDHNEQQV